MSTGGLEQAAWSPCIFVYLGVFGSDGQKMKPFWFDPKRKIDQEYYMEIMEDTVLPWINSTYGEANVAYVWQQDGR